MNIRFHGAEGTAPVPRKNEQILPHLAKLVNPQHAISEDLTLAFADAWVKDAPGAITTLADVFSEASKEVKAVIPPTTRKGMPSRREDAAFVAGQLGYYLSFFRREFWDAAFPGQLIREFAERPSRSDETIKNAMSIGLPPRKGAWFEAVNFIRAYASREFFRVLQKRLPGEPAEQSPPTPTPPRVSHRRWDDEEDKNPPFTSWHINDYRPDKDDDFLD